MPFERAIRVLLIAPNSSYRTAAYAGAIGQCGFECVVASTGQQPVAGLSGDIVIELDSAQKDADLVKLQKQHARSPFSGIVATDDSTVELAAALATSLNLPGNSIDAVRATYRKDLLRQALSGCSLLVPSCRTVKLDRPVDQQIASVTYPCVAKPMSLSASRGVIRADGRVDLELALDRIRILLEKEYLNPQLIALVEDFIPGKEVAVEGLLTDGELQLLTVFDKPDSLNGPYFEETIYVTPSMLKEEVLVGIKGELSKACRILGLRHGPVHVECRLNHHGIWIIDLASRSIGGRCGRLLKYGAGVSLEELIVKNAVGIHCDRGTFGKSVGIMMIPVPENGGVLRRVEGIGKASRVPLVTGIEIDVRPGQILTPWPEGCAYPGFIFAQGEQPEQIIEALHSAHSRLEFVLAPSLKVSVKTNLST